MNKTTTHTLKYSINIPEILPDLEDIVRLFFKDYKRCDEGQKYLIQTIEFLDGKVFSIIKTDIACPYDFSDSEPFLYTEKSLEYFKYLKRFSKNALYKALKRLTGVSLPWGSLTGIRPTRLAYELKESSLSDELIPNALKKSFDISKPKLELLIKILHAQEDIYTVDQHAVNLYVNIPVCTSRCSYCSFISSELKRCEHLLDKYSQLVAEEIKLCLDLIQSKDKYIRTVYIGGGTPTALNAEQLEKILSVIPKDTLEFTVEAGRPDTITKEKLDLLHAHNVSRISINPQSFSKTVLDAIGRGHTVDDFYIAYRLARDNYNFSINMDLIAGLPKDTMQDFMQSVNKTIELRPDNITVHTLSLKSGSVLKQQEYNNFEMIEDMVNFAYKTIIGSGYMPYYLYRQKNMLGNLENTGYCLPKKQCVNNIDTMEESISVIACGAGAISKRLFGGGKIVRSANVKNIDDYINRFDEMKKRKENLFLKP